MVLFYTRRKDRKVNPAGLAESLHLPPAIRGRTHVPLDVLSDTLQPFPTFSEIHIAALKALPDEIAAKPKLVAASP